MTMGWKLLAYATCIQIIKYHGHYTINRLVVPADYTVMPNPDRWEQ